MYNRINLTLMTIKRSCFLPGSLEKVRICRERIRLNRMYTEVIEGWLEKSLVDPLKSNYSESCDAAKTRLTNGKSRRLYNHSPGLHDAKKPSRKTNTQRK